MVHGLNIAKIMEKLLPTVANCKEAAAHLWPPKPPLPKFTYKRNLEHGGNLGHDKCDCIVKSSQVWGKDVIPERTLECWWLKHSGEAADGQNTHPVARGQHSPAYPFLFYPMHFLM